MPKSKITFEQLDSFGKENTKYNVVSLTNRTRPLIGTILNETEVQKLQTESEDLTIEIKPSKKRR